MSRIQLLILILIFAAGCGPTGPTRAEVSGTVTYNGQPVEQGAISFFPAPGVVGPEAGGEIKNGKYFIPRKTGPVVGKNRVELRSFQKSGRRIQDPTAPPGTLTDEITNIFPPEFSSQSTLTKDIQKGKNEIVFEIKSP
jgi:hypothetical protein